MKIVKYAFNLFGQGLQIEESYSYNGDTWP